MNRKQQSDTIPQNNREAPTHLEEANFPVYANPNIVRQQDNYYACPRQLGLRAWRDGTGVCFCARNGCQELSLVERKDRNKPIGTFLTAKKRTAILLIFERSSIVHENICFGACHLTITFYEEKEIYREKNKTLQATDFSLNLSTDIFT